MEKISRKTIKEKGHFTIEAIGPFVAGTIVLPGHPPLSADPTQSKPADPGIVIRFAKAARRTFDVLAAADDYATKMMATVRGIKTAEMREEQKDYFIDEMIGFLNDYRLWHEGDIEFYKSPEEVNAEREFEQIASIGTDKMLEDLQRRGVLPKGKLSKEDINTALRAFLKDKNLGKGSAAATKEQQNAGG